MVTFTHFLGATNLHLMHWEEKAYPFFSGKLSAVQRTCPHFSEKARGREGGRSILGVGPISPRSDEKLAWLSFDVGTRPWLGQRALLTPLLSHCSPFWQVLHPGLLSQVQMDLLLMKMGSRILALLPGIKWLSLPEIVEEFEKLMVQQVNSSLSCQ